MRCSAIDGWVVPPGNQRQRAARECTPGATAVASACRARDLTLPRLLCEPGRSLVASPGLTLYRLGSRKQIPGWL